MIKNLCDIGQCNDNPFDGEQYKTNIHSILINPLGIVIVQGGNHSTNSAIIHNEGNLIVNNEVDISPLFKKYKFDGSDYINLETNEKVNIHFLKNNSQPFLYSLGLLFEISRIMAEK